VPGEQLVRSRFVEPSGIRRAAVPVPEGLLEVTVGVEPERSLGGLLKPGDTVAVLASFEPFEVKTAPIQPGQDLSAFAGEGDPIPIPLPIDGQQVVALPTPAETPNRTEIIGDNVLVTRVQLEASEPDINPDDESTGVAPTKQLLVTLAMDAEGVEDVVFTKEFGTVWLALQPAGSDTEGNPGGTTRASIFEVQ
jgi:pilus assembly protein CpaB